MKQVSLSGSLRAGVGRKDAAELRKAKRVPAVIYGNGTQTHFHASYIDMGKIIFTANVFEVIIDIDGKKTPAIIQEIQLDPVSDKIVHVDFLELVEGKAVKIKLPVSLVGVSKGVRAGGKLSQVFRKLAVVGEKKSLPEAIEISIENLKIGQDVRVRDIKIPGLKFLDPAAAVVVAVKAARGAVTDNDDDAAEAPAAEAEKTEAAAE